MLFNLRQHDHRKFSFSQDRLMNCHGNPSLWAIEARSLNMVYQTRKESYQALTGVDILVPVGELHMVIGPSGAGKTTLLLILAGLLKPTSGHVSLLGNTLSQLSRSQREQFRLKHLGLMFQEANLMDSLTVAENLALTLSLKGIHGHENQQKVQDLLEQVGLREWSHYLPHNLSGGQQQRVALARAVAGAPKIIIADEPTGALDSENGMNVMHLLKRLITSVGCSVLMSTHDHRVTALADQLIYLEDGCIKQAPDATQRSDSIAEQHESDHQKD